MRDKGLEDTKVDLKWWREFITVGKSTKEMERVMGRGVNKRYKYGLRVMCLYSGKPMRTYGIGVSDTLPPPQEDVIRWCNKEYAVICWFVLDDIDKATESGLEFNNYFKEGL